MNCICGNWKFSGGGMTFGVIVMANQFAIVAEGHNVRCQCGRGYFMVPQSSLMGSELIGVQREGAELIWPMDQSTSYSIGGLSLAKKEAEASLTVFAGEVAQISPAFGLAQTRVYEIAERTPCPLCGQFFGQCNALSPGLVHTEDGSFNGCYGVLGYPTACQACGFSFFFVYMDEWAPQALRDVYLGQEVVPFFPVMDRYSSIQRGDENLYYSFHVAVHLKHYLFLCQKEFQNKRAKVHYLPAAKAQ